MKTTFISKILLSSALLFAGSSFGQNVPQQGDYTRSRNMTPREIVQVRQQLLAKYPALDENFLNSLPKQAPQEHNQQSSPINVPLQAPGQKLVYASIMSANNWSPYDIPEYRMWSFPLEASESVTFTKLSDADINANGGGVAIGTTYHFFNTFTSDYSDAIYTYYNAYNYRNWSQLSRTSVSNGLIATDLTYDPTTDLAYGCFYTDDLSGFELASIDFNEGFKRTIVPLGSGHFLGLAFNNEGQLYGISWDSKLFKINKKTGEMTLVGPLGITFSRARQTAFFDEDTNQMYFSGLVDNNNSGLYTINTSTGAATLLASYPHGEQLVGGFIPKAQAADDAPYRATNLKADFPGNATTGTVSFTLPDETVGGDDLNGSLHYTLTANGVVVADSNGNAGTKVTVNNVTVENGKVKFVVVCSNSAGKGEEAKLVTYVGYDEPLAPQNVTLDISSDGTATISWTTPAKGLHDKDLNPSDLTYTIVRYPGEETVATNVSGNSYTDHIDPALLQYHYYMITPYNHGIEGLSAYSNRKVFGNHLLIPYYETFDTADAFDLFNVVNVNKDNATWNLGGENEAVYSSMFAQGAANDWLITPPLQLHADRSYIFTFKCAGRPLFGFNDSEQQFEVYYGKGKDVASMTLPILENGRVRSYDLQTFTFILRPTTDGDYSIGFHVTTPQKTEGSKMILDDLSVEVNAMNEAPAAVSNLNVTPAPKGAKRATISFDAPTKNSADGTLSGITKIDVYRNGNNLVHTFNNPAKGASLSYEDNVEEDGETTYTVVASNQAGEGVKASGSAFIGIDQPLPPSNVRLTETGEDQVLVTWTPPTVGVHGGYVDPDALKYTVQRSDAAWMTLSQVGATSFTSDESSVSLSWKQDLLYYHVHAANDAGQSGRGTSNSIMIGDPYRLPYYESFSTGFTNNQGWTNIGPGNFNLYYTTISSDGDGHCAMFTPSGNTKAAEYVSSKISLEGAVQPALRFSYYAYPGSDARLKVSVQKNADDETIELEEFDFNNLSGEEGWREAVVDIENVDDARYIRLHFRAESNDINTPVAFDNLQVRDLVPYNLKGQLSVPRYVRAAEDNNFYVKVENIGTQDARNFKVKLFANDKTISEINGGTLQSYNDSTYCLTWKPALTDEGVVQIHAEVDFEYDADKDDNTTPNVAVVVEHSAYPTVDLDGKLEGTKAILTWNAPTIETGIITEDFEKYSLDNYLNFGDWTTYDQDGGGTWRIREFGEYPGKGDALSWILFNTDYADERVKAHSGDQFLLTVSSNYMDAMTNANWLMSPQLTGDEQEVSFWYRVLDSTIPERMKILYSYNSNHYEDFIELAAENEMTNNEWEEYTFTMPEGAKFFAVEYVTPTLSPDGFAMMVDDFKFEGIGSKLEIAGYNVYRDGILVATLDSSATGWEEEAQDKKLHTYTVSVIYTIGESTYSNAVNLSLEQAGINMDGETLSIGSRNGEIIIKGAGENEVYISAIDGRVVYEGKGDATVSVEPACYIVKVGNQAMKLIVK